MGYGYHTTRDDAIIKTFGDVTLTVIPEYVSGAKLKITLLVSAKSKADVNALLTDGVFFSLLNTSSEIYPAKLSITEQESAAGEHFSQWHVLVFPLSVDEIETFKLTVPWINSSDPSPEDSLLNFNFEKVEVADFYYNSINC